jgi:hypothetical protein
MRHARTFSAARRRACRPDRLRTIAVGRHVLLIADVRVEDRAGPAGSRIRDTEQDGQARVLALQVSGSTGLDWSPHRGYLLAAGDRLIVLATRRA